MFYFTGEMCFCSKSLHPPHWTYFGFDTRAHAFTLSMQLNTSRPGTRRGFPRESTSCNPCKFWFQVCKSSVLLGRPAPIVPHYVLTSTQPESSWETFCHPSKPIITFTQSLPLSFTRKHSVIPNVPTLLIFTCSASFFLSGMVKSLAN